MFFENHNIDAEILSVMHLTWQNMHLYAAARDFCALSYRRKGGADFTHNGTKRHISPGEIIYVPVGYDYKIDAEDEELFVVHFNINGKTEPDFDIFSPEDISYFERKFIDMYTAWSQKKSGYVYECKAGFYKILENALKQKSEKQADRTALIVEEAAEYIHEHYAEKDLTVEFLAKRAGMSDTYFRKLFVGKFAATPLKYINALRIERSAEMLLYGYYSVSETAEKCGFDSQNYFSNVFKKIKGISPLQYKKGCKTAKV